MCIITPVSGIVCSKSVSYFVSCDRSSLWDRRRRFAPCPLEGCTQPPLVGLQLRGLSALRSTKDLLTFSKLVGRTPKCTSRFCLDTFGQLGSWVNRGNNLSRILLLLLSTLGHLRLDHLVRDEMRRREIVQVTLCQNSGHALQDKMECLIIRHPKAGSWNKSINAREQNLPQLLVLLAGQAQPCYELTASQRKL